MDSLPQGRKPWRLQRGCGSPQAAGEAVAVAVVAVAAAVAVVVAAAVAAVVAAAAVAAAAVVAAVVAAAVPAAVAVVAVVAVVPGVWHTAPVLEVLEYRGARPSISDSAAPATGPCLEADQREVLCE